MAHVRALAALRSRTAGTSGESKAIRYVRKNLRGTGTHVRLEPFPFRTYDLERARLRVGDAGAQPVHVVFDPYRGTSKIEGEAAFVAAAVVNGETGVAGVDLSRRVVVTTQGAQYHRIAGGRPEAIVYLSDDDFERLRAVKATRAALLLKGRVRTRTSANLVATSQTGDASREIILSAHIDSAGTPGAQDNGSGVAVLLELARTLPALKLPFRLRFVFFGAEEVGLLGSRAYLDRHREDLQRCALLFNMDSVGGKDIWIDMRGGVRNLPAANRTGRLLRQPPALARGDFRQWTFIGSSMIDADASNVPPWLQTAILDSVRELGYQIHQGQGAGSDHRVFSEAGVVATNIAIGGIRIHSPEDVPEQIDAESLERAARIVTGVVTRSIAALTLPRSRRRTLSTVAAGPGPYRR